MSMRTSTGSSSSRPALDPASSVGAAKTVDDSSTETDAAAVMSASPPSPGSGSARDRSRLRVAAASCAPVAVSTSRTAATSSAFFDDLLSPSGHGPAESRISLSFTTVSFSGSAAGDVRVASERHRTVLERVGDSGREDQPPTALERRAHSPLAASDQLDDANRRRMSSAAMRIPVASDYLRPPAHPRRLQCRLGQVNPKLIPELPASFRPVVTFVRALDRPRWPAPSSKRRSPRLARDAPRDPHESPGSSAPQLAVRATRATQPWAAATPSSARVPSLC